MSIGGALNSRNIQAPRTEDSREIDSWEQQVAMRVQNVLTGRGRTSGAATADLLDFILPNNTVVGFKGWILGRRLSGSGSLNDGYAALIRAGYKNIDGSITAMSSIGPVLFHLEEGDSASFASTFVISAPRLVLRVTGAMGYEMSWAAFLRFVAVGE